MLRYALLCSVMPFYDGSMHFSAPLCHAMPCHAMLETALFSLLWTAMLCFDMLWLNYPCDDLLCDAVLFSALDQLERLRQQQDARISAIKAERTKIARAMEYNFRYMPAGGAAGSSADVKAPATAAAAAAAVTVSGGCPPQALRPPRFHFKCVPRFTNN
jgi:hypothetical protein